MSYNDVDPSDWTFYNPNYYYDEENEKYIIDRQVTSDDSKENKTQIKNSEKLKMVTKEIVSCRNNKQIKNKVIRILLNMNMNTKIYLYGMREYLPERYVSLAREKNCVETLIKSFLKTHLHYVLTSKIINEIDSLLKVIYNNQELDIVYDRVKKIQKFIHKKADEKFDNNAFLKLSPTAMRKLLSTSRLHLNIFDSKELEVESLISIISKSKNEHHKYPDIKYTFSGIKAKRNYSKDFETLITIDDTLISSINQINKLDQNKLSVVFRKEILKIFVSSQ